MKKDGLLLWGLLLLIIFEILIFFLPMKINISDRIQGGSIVALVFVTCFYAKQTWRLVEEQRNTLNEIIEKRKVDLLERRLVEFYKPATYALAQISIDFNSGNIEGVLFAFRQLQLLDAKVDYLASGNMRVLFREFLAKFVPYIVKEKLSDKLKEAFPDIVDKLGVFLQAEYLRIEKRLRDFYKEDYEDDFLEEREANERKKS
jgi:hypothetical protein